ncbi:hypothetical protein ABPG72_011319 [Tetrahymena utriculariae]
MVDTNKKDQNKISVNKKQIGSKEELTYQKKKEDEEKLEGQERHEKKKDQEEQKDSEREKSNECKEGQGPKLENPQNQNKKREKSKELEVLETKDYYKQKGRDTITGSTHDEDLKSNLSNKIEKKQIGEQVNLQKQLKKEILDLQAKVKCVNQKKFELQVANKIKIESDNNDEQQKKQNKQLNETLMEKVTKLSQDFEFQKNQVEELQSQMIYQQKQIEELKRDIDEMKIDTYTSQLATQCINYFLENVMNKKYKTFKQFNQDKANEEINKNLLQNFLVAIKIDNQSKKIIDHKKQRDRVKHPTLQHLPQKIDLIASIFYQDDTEEYCQSNQNIFDFLQKDENGKKKQQKQ